MQPPSVPSLRKSSNPVPAPIPTPIAEPSVSQNTTPSKKYGGLVQTPPSTRGQRVYSDAAAYNQQLSQHQSYTAQVQAQNSVRHQPFSPGYEPPQSSQSSPYSSRVASHSHAIRPQEQAPAWSGSALQPQQPAMGHRIMSQGLPASASHSSLRMNAPMIASQTNPPPNSYYPSSRNRANTINQMDAIPPAIARLAHFGAPDPSGTRNLTPVLNRGDDGIREWERRQAGHSRTNSIATSSYPQLEYLQEQAELAAMGATGGWMYPGAYGQASAGGGGHRGHAHRPSHDHSHSHSMSGTQTYQMQPGIGSSHPSPGGQMMGDYGREYGSSSASSRPYLPAFPPPAAVTSSPHAGFDGFDGRDHSMGMMYTPLQPNQYQGGAGGAGGGGGHMSHGSHGSRASFSGPYQGQSQSQTSANNPFASGQIAPGQNQNQPPPTSPRYQRRSGGYGA